MSGEAKTLIGIGVVTLALIIGAVFFLGKPERPTVVDSSRLVKADSLKTSSASAKLTIVEFGDYQCPACKLAFPGLKQALSDFPGQVNFVFRHYPLPQHKNSQTAAKAVEAANLQGKVWSLHDKLYESQDEWGESDTPLEFFKKYAVELGLDPQKLISDMNNSSIQDKINNDISDGAAIGVNSTPTFYFNNELYKKGYSYQEFKSEIESRLK